MEYRLRVPAKPNVNISWELYPELVNTIFDLEIYSIVCNKDDYYLTLENLIFNDEDTTEYTQIYIPELDHTSFIELPIDTEKHKDRIDKKIIFEDLERLRILWMGSLIQVHISSTGFFFYRTYFSDMKRKLALADFYFYTKNYMKAQKSYEDLLSYSEYAERMFTIASLIINAPPRSSKYSWDLLLDYKHHQVLYHTVSLIPFQYTKCIYYFLSQSNKFGTKIQTYIDYIAFEIFLKNKNKKKAKTYIERIEERLIKEKNIVCDGERSYIREMFMKIVSRYSLVFDISFQISKSWD